MPSVSYCADQLHLSTNYFGHLVEKETGNTATDYIQSRLIEHAKISILEANHPISEVAFQLSFKYQEHFTRLFKKKTGMTPFEFRNLN
ncbi:hypothetical protein Q763_02105 [Flavobacterium beibuense F44-8]|uniref:HTH araC/xylS-type domain-containing protein n=1 Tax=Flavobacterium beibuense F44-8 TaxID=1406840 RepID=A0A0A2LVX5_9FLAO|nr:helix-turn-helix transcriptional regulator [Flavobacterium beibuense]KGO83383.1 hypothetical protein Q763_02105 [Flavobacterium beibuense F44-8]